MSVETPHLAVRLKIGAAGAVVVEQDSPEDVAACVQRIAVCPIGFREDLPAFGAPELAFETVPLHLDAWTEAVQEWEPRADLQTSEQAEGVEQAIRDVNVTVSVQ